MGEIQMFVTESHWDEDKKALVITVKFTDEYQGLIREAAKNLVRLGGTALLEKLAVPQDGLSEDEVVLACGGRECSRCKKARYCSRACQVKDFPRHKKADGCKK